MADGTVLVKQQLDGDRLIDNEVLDIGGETVYRQRVQVPAPVQTRDLLLTPLGYEQLTPVAATGLTVPVDAIYALLQARSGDVSYRDDGADPTNTVGMRLVQDASMFYTGDLAALRFISSAGTLDVLYYGID